MKRLNGFLAFFLLLAALSAGLSAGAPTFPISAANINNGTVMPISPRWPFPQFLEYNFGKSLANTPPDGMNHAEMEAQMTRAYLEMGKRFEQLGGWKPTTLPRRLNYQSACGTGNGTPGGGCTEGAGYALLATALMADKDTFDGFWVHLHSFIPEVVSYEVAAATVQNPTYGDGGRCSSGGLVGWNHTVNANSATDGDVDIALALLIAWKQWGDNSGHVDAGGRAISYRQEFISYTRAMAGFTENPMIPGRYWQGIIGIDGYQTGGDSFGEETTWATSAAHPPKYPRAVDNCSSAGICSNYLSYLAPGYMHCFKSEWDSLGDTVIANQYWRNAFSSRDIIRQLNASQTPWSVGTDCYDVADDGSVSFTTPWGNSTEGVRTPMRNALDYLWYGQPAYRWDPVTHEVLAGGPGVNIQRTMASRLSQLFWDPRQAPASNPTFSAATGLNFWGPSQIQIGINQNGVMSTGNHIPVIIGPAAMAACAADDLDAATIPGRQLTLMKNLWRECFLVWDKDSGSYDGSADSKANGYTPAYFHDWFRLQGLLTLSGNFHSPCEMVPQANVKIYKSVDKTFAFAGDTLTYHLNLRNYGSVTATGLQVSDVLPPELEYVSSTPAGSAAGQNVSWNLPNLAGLQNANRAATLTGITLVARVRTTVPSGTRFCNTATVTLGNGPGWTSNEFPNDQSLVFRRNCVDVANRALGLTKTASAPMATFGDTITFTLAVSSDANAGWIDGGRPQVIPNFAAILEPWGPVRMSFSLKSEATEPLIDFGNYRYSFFFEDFLYGGTAGPLTTASYMIDATRNPTGARTLADFSFFSEDITAGSDANGRWNRRYVYRMFSCLPDGCQNEHYTRKYHNNFGLNWQYGDLASPNYVAVDVYPTADANRPTTLWSTNAWSWMPGMGDLNYGTNPPEPRPVSPDWTDGNPATPGVFNNLFDTFAVETATPYTRVLVEEWDGYVWRRVFGNGPVPNRDLAGVVVTDVLPNEFEWGGMAADSDVSGSWNAGTRTVTFNVGTLLTNQVRTLKFWATVRPNGGGAGQFNYPSFPHNAVNTGCAVASNESQVCDDATVQILNVPPPTPTPTPGDLSKSAAPATVAAGGNVTYNLAYRNTKGSYVAASTAAFTGWTNSGYTSSGTYFYNASASNHRVDFNNAPMSGAGPVTVEWDLRGENFQWFGVQFLNNGTDKNGFWIDLFPSDPFNSRLRVYRDGVLLGSELTGVPAAGDFSLRAVFVGGNLTLYLNNVQIYTQATTLPAGAGTKAGMHNGNYAGTGGAMQHRLYAMRVWTDRALDLQVWDTLPACLNYVSASPAPASAPAVGSNGVVRWGPMASPGLAYNQVYSVTVVAQVTGACACGPLNNMGVGLPTGIAAQSASAGITVSCGGTPTFTPTPSPSPTRTSSPSPTPSPTASPSPSPTRSPLPSPTATPSPSATRSPSPSASVSPSPSGTPSASPSRTTSPSGTPTSSATITLSATPSRSASQTASLTPSPSSTLTTTPSRTASVTVTITFLDTYTVSPTISPTPTASPTATPSLSPSSTRSASPSITPSPSETPVASATSTWTISPSPSSSPTATPSGSPSATLTDSPTGTASPSATASFTASPIYTSTVTPTVTPTFSDTATRTVSPSPTATRTATATATASATLTATRTLTATSTATQTATASATLSATRTISPSPSDSPTQTATLTATETATPFISPTITATFSVSPTQVIRFYQQDDLVKERGVYPNPFSEHVRLYFTLRVDAVAKLTVYNVAGEPLFVRDYQLSSGKREISWDGHNNAGARCASGIYILRLQAEGVDKSSGGYWTTVAIQR